MTTKSQQTWAADGRYEHIQRPVDIKTTVVVPGVELWSLVSAHSGSRDLFTALLTLNPKSSYPLYTRPFTEVLILVEGDASVEVEDRRYRLKSFDALTVSPRIPRRVVNLSSSHLAVFLVAMAAGNPEQTWVNGRFTVTDQSLNETGRIGAERICRNDSGCAIRTGALRAVSGSLQCGSWRGGNLRWLRPV